MALEITCERIEIFRLWSSSGNFARNRHFEVLGEFGAVLEGEETENMILIPNLHTFHHGWFVNVIYNFYSNTL